jgi:long-chain acyl-CoA synthetase
LSNPLSLLPIALAAGGGRIDGTPGAQLVAAGFTLLQRSAPLVRALAGRRSAILLPSSGAFVSALAASDGRGAVLLNPLAAPPEIAFQIDDANVGAVFTNRALAARLPAGARPVVLLDDAPRTATVIAGGSETVIDLGSHFGLDLEGEAEAGSDEECVIVYTSAMAGTALGAVLTHRNLMANARSAIDAISLNDTDHVLAALPFSHLFGFTTTLAASLMAGARITTMERFHPVRALDIIENDGVTVLVGVPAMYGGLVKMLERRGSPPADPMPRVCLCGGAPLQRALQDRWFELTGEELRQGYGLTEAGPCSLFNVPHYPNRRGTLGIPFPGVHVSIRDPGTSAALPAGTDGELCIRGDNVFRGYLRDGHLGLQVRDGWLHTGDRAVERADGSFEFLGLIKPMFTHKGFNVYPAELERVLRDLPGVSSVRAYAIHEPAHENDIGLEISGTVTEAQVRQWCEARLGAYKQPERVVITPG